MDNKTLIKISIAVAFAIVYILTMAGATMVAPDIQIPTPIEILGLFL